MPLVIVNRNPYKVYSETLDALVLELPKLVTEALSIPNTDGELKHDDVEVWIRDQRREYESQHFDLEIVIFANQYPERLQNLDERREEIGRGIRYLLSLKKCDNVRCFVWVLLQPGSFGMY